MKWFFRVLMAVYFFLYATSAFTSELGGMMTGNGCYNGGQFVPNVSCLESRVGTSFYDFRVKVYAKASYLDTIGQKVKVDLVLTLEDPTDYFHPEAEVPVLVRGIIRSFHRESTFSVQSESVIFKRNPNERVLVGQGQFILNNNFGAEYAELLNKLEILIPGKEGILVVYL